MRLSRCCRWSLLFRLHSAFVFSVSSQGQRRRVSFCVNTGTWMTFHMPVVYYLSCFKVAIFQCTITTPWCSVASVCYVCSLHWWQLPGACAAILKLARVFAWACNSTWLLSVRTWHACKTYTSVLGSRNGWLGIKKFWKVDRSVECSEQSLGWQTSAAKQENFSEK